MTTTPPREGYYILCLKTGPAGDSLLWWRPNNAGYTIALEAAGVYTQADLDALAREHLGFASLRPGQREAVEAVLPYLSLLIMNEVEAAQLCSALSLTFEALAVPNTSAPRHLHICSAAWPTPPAAACSKTLSPFCRLP